MSVAPDDDDHHDRPVPPLYSAIQYAVELEAEGLRRLTEMDVAGCRRCFGALLRRLDLGAVEGNGQGHDVTQLLLDVLHKINRRVHGSGGDDRVYQAQRVRLIQEFSRCPSADRARERFVGALNWLLAPVEPHNGSRHPLVRRAILYIQHNYQKRIFLSTIARQLNVSPNYLSRLFRLHTGVTLTAFVQRLRVEHARLLLAEGSRGIAEIAYVVGYQNYRDFYRNFVKYESASPREVRRQLEREAGRWRAGDRFPAADASRANDNLQF